jgi:uncharacterized membrane protein
MNRDQLHRMQILFFGIRSKCWRILCYFGLIQLASVTVVHAAATFIPLGVFEGIRSRGHDISADGSLVVGTFFQGGANPYRLFRWTHTNNVLGFSAQDLAAVSSNGTVVGALPSGLPPHSVAMRWNDDGTVRRLGNSPVLPTDIGSAASDVSTDATVIVGGMGSLVGNPEAFRWTEATGMVGLGGLPDAAVWSSAFGTSADGSIIVGQARNADSILQAFRWTEETGMVALSLPANARTASAFSVSADGSQVVGHVSIAQPAPAEGHDVAFRWTAATGMVGLGDLPGGRVNSRGSDISADGSVIVGTGETFFEDGVGSINEAFYWTAAAGMLNLRDLLISGGATGLDGWLLTEASGVSADGFTVVGTAVSPMGMTQAFVATIPEPATMILGALAAAGLVAFLRFKRGCGFSGHKSAVRRSGAIRRTPARVI